MSALRRQYGRFSWYLARLMKAIAISVVVWPVNGETQWRQASLPVSEERIADNVDFDAKLRSSPMSCKYITIFCPAINNGRLAFLDLPDLSHRHNRNIRKESRYAGTQCCVCFRTPEIWIIEFLRYNTFGEASIIGISDETSSNSPSSVYDFDQDSISYQPVATKCLNMNLFKDNQRPLDFYKGALSDVRASFGDFDGCQHISRLSPANEERGDPEQRCRDGEDYRKQGDDTGKKRVGVINGPMNSDDKIAASFLLGCVCLGALVGSSIGGWAIWYARRPLPHEDCRDQQRHRSDK